MAQSHGVWMVSRESHISVYTARRVKQASAAGVRPEAHHDLLTPGFPVSQHASQEQKGEGKLAFYTYSSINIIALSHFLILCFFFVFFFLFGA